MLVPAEMCQNTNLFLFLFAMRVFCDEKAYLPTDVNSNGREGGSP
jgi:hypothetical protein